jgi:hypothetical protein
LANAALPSGAGNLPENDLAKLAEITVLILAQTMNVMEPYAAELRKGRHVPHPMHFAILTKALTNGVSRRFVSARSSLARLIGR